MKDGKLIISFSFLLAIMLCFLFIASERILGFCKTCSMPLRIILSIILIVICITFCVVLIRIIFCICKGEDSKLEIEKAKLDKLDKVLETFQNFDNYDVAETKEKDGESDSITRKNQVLAKELVTISTIILESN